jgi:hypothetical protein
MILVMAAPASVIWELAPVTSPIENVGVIVTVEDIGGSKIQFTVEMDPLKDSGDLTGLFFNIAGGVTGVTESMFTGVDVDEVCVEPSGTLECRNDNNLNGVSGLPAGSFTVGMAFGTAGDDGITTTVVIFNYALSGRTFSEEDFAPVAARVKSIEGTGGSAKLLDLVPTVPDTETQVPEPSTWLMMGAGLGLVTLAKIRRGRRS